MRGLHVEYSRARGAARIGSDADCHLVSHRATDEYTVTHSDDHADPHT